MKHLMLAALIGFAPAAMALRVDMHEVDSDGVGDSIGTVSFRNSDDGLLIQPDLEGLDSGIHGFHVHENGSCEPGEKDGDMAAAVAAGGHFDPDDTGRHRGPYSDDGHLGDLPVLMVDEEGATRAYRHSRRDWRRTIWRGMRSLSTRTETITPIRRRSSAAVADALPAAWSTNDKLDNAETIPGRVAA